MVGSLGVGMKCVKLFLVTINFLFLIIGILTVATGVIVLVNYDIFDLFLQSYHLIPAKIVISVGALTIFTCFVGFLAATKQSTLIVNTYALCLTLTLILEIVLTIVALIYRDDLYTNVKMNMANGMSYYKSNRGIQESWDVTQEVLHCCGVSNSAEWAPYKVPGHEIFQGGHYTVPYSCCSDSFCQYQFTTGCFKNLKNYISHSISTFFYLILGNVFVKIFAVILARMLAQAIRRIKSEREMQRQINMQWDTLSRADSARNNFTSHYGADRS